MKRKQYSAEFKQMLFEKMRAGVPVSQLAREHEPSAQTLHHWKRAMLESKGSDAELQEENRRLKNKVRQLEEDREILEKAAVWFAAKGHAAGTSS